MSGSLADLPLDFLLFSLLRHSFRFDDIVHNLYSGPVDFANDGFWLVNLDLFLGRRRLAVGHSGVAGLLLIVVFLKRLLLNGVADVQLGLIFIPFWFLDEFGFFILLSTLDAMIDHHRPLVNKGLEILILLISERIDILHLFRHFVK